LSGSHRSGVVMSMRCDETLAMIIQTNGAKITIDTIPAPA
jgi:hypothetical protein